MLDRLSGPGAVEIDDMRPFGAGRSKLGQGLRGIGSLNRRRVEPALTQAHDLSAHQVHGGIEDHAASQAWRKRAPASPERSGWNWAPQ